MMIRQLDKESGDKLFYKMYDYLNYHNIRSVSNSINRSIIVSIYSSVRNTVNRSIRNSIKDIIKKEIDK